ncbi:hypothetical protein VST7929_03205 [Vibrio stylophorae]|uniref:Uncharacterized protein n=1 Tax=Vibrio stylophorae TaxID=659351 RepID=A0ABM8ZY07_9VIBR|nr:hypothetical protein [Vibrio stylophorae]CAH0535731.1 hypothetical protein VST7929_03205 [Vibrio stylophorae]
MAVERWSQIKSKSLNRLKWLGRLLFDFMKYYLCTVIVFGAIRELSNLALRVWSDNQAQFYNDGMWQVTLILSFFFSLYLMIMKWMPS